MLWFILIINFIASNQHNLSHRIHLSNQLDVRQHLLEFFSDLTFKGTSTTVDDLKVLKQLFKNIIILQKLVENKWESIEKLDLTKIFC